MQRVSVTSSVVRQSSVRRTGPPGLWRDDVVDGSSQPSTVSYTRSGAAERMGENSMVAHWSPVMLNKAKTSRPRPKFWPRGHFGLEDLTSLLVSYHWKLPYAVTRFRRVTVNTQIIPDCWDWLSFCACGHRQRTPKPIVKISSFGSLNHHLQYSVRTVLK